jgi:hypothetical protein
MKRCSIIVYAITLLTGLFYIFTFQKPINAAPVQNLKDSMSTSRLSFFARIGAGTVAGDSLIKIATNGNPSKTTSNVFSGDTLAIGISNGGSTIYTVKDIGNTVTIEVGSTLAANNSWVGSYLIATSSAVHTVSFSPMSTVAQGVWQVLIRATNRTGESSNDGIPDQMGFDLGSTTPTSGASGLGTRLKAADVTCPWTGVASVGTTVTLTSADGIGVGATGSYHVISCALPAGTNNPVGTGVTGVITIGRPLASGSQLINPAPALLHTEGQAGVSPNNTDIYNIIVRHTDSSGNIITADTTIGKIAVVESVRVSAIVDPTITFYIDNVGTSAAGVPRCGTAIGAGAPNTTATSVSFGSITLDGANNLAQRFSCTTNAKSGYTIQVYENGPLKNLNTDTTIPDTNCDGACSVTTASAWTTFSDSEFGYSLEAISGSPVAFSNANGYKAFGVGSANAQTIMSRAATPLATDQGYICYRVTASNFQEAGSYENNITFLATATF